MTADISITSESPLSADAQNLLAELTDELAARYGDDGGVYSFNPADVLMPRSAFLIARRNGLAVGCGAVRQLKPEIGEIKRMYVVPDARGLGISRLLLTRLEALAREFGYAWLWLETGTKQPEALGLYASCGFHRRESYGYYKDDPASICLEKRL